MDGRFFTQGAIAPVPPRIQAPAGLAVPEPFDPTTSLHDPPLEPRDEAVFLLTAAAEVEHALMAQYLYAAYSVRVDAGDVNDPRRAVQGVLRQIAREEMGHLATVQNLLHVVGGPLYLGRDPAPSSAGVHPFRFRLEPVSLGSLAKYVIAESPSPLPPDFLTDDGTLYDQLLLDAAAANDGEPVRHVGRIFARLHHLFTVALTDDDISTDTVGRHATFPDWGYDPQDLAVGDPLIVDEISGPDAAAVRAAAADAVRAIGAQGEGFDPGPVEDESHFERFLNLYKTVAALTASGVEVAREVTTDPNTTHAPAARFARGTDAATEEQRAPGRITHERARAWAQLFNMRYRMLLGTLAHFLRVDGPRYGPDGDRTARGLLLIATFDEMRHLAKIAGKLVELPMDAA
jgi:Ferritin-like